MTKTFAAITAAAILATSTACAGEISLSRPIDGASLHDHGVDMVVYYTDEHDHFAVTATYVMPGTETAPRRMRMALTDGDRVSFALPGRPQTQYTFARKTETVTVTSRSTGTDLAQR